MSTEWSGKKESGDDRMLGNDDFVHAILKETMERELWQLKLKRSGMTIQTISERINVTSTFIYYQHLVLANHSILLWHCLS